MPIFGLSMSTPSSVWVYPCNVAEPAIRTIFVLAWMEKFSKQESFLSIIASFNTVCGRLAEGSGEFTMQEEHSLLTGQ